MKTGEKANTHNQHWLTSTRFSPFSARDRAGQRSYVKLLRGRREEPGNEASLLKFYTHIQLVVAYQLAESQSLAWVATRLDI